MAKRQAHVQGNNDSVINKPPKSHDGSSGSGLLLVLCFGVVMAAVGMVNLKREIGIFTKRSRVKTQGTGVLGTITVSDQRHGYTGVKKKPYSYYLHEVRYAGYERTFQRSRQIPVGAVVPVFYLPEDPQTAMIGHPSQTVSDFKRSRFRDIFGLCFGFAVYSVMAIVGGGLVLLVMVRGIPDVLHRGIKRKTAATVGRLAEIPEGPRLSTSEAITGKTARM